MDRVWCLDVVILVLSVIKDVSKLRILIRSSKLILSQIMFHICELYRRLTKQVAPSLTNFVQLEKLVVPQAVKKFPTFYEPEASLRCSKICPWSLPWVGSIQFTHSISLGSIYISASWALPPLFLRPSPKMVVNG